MPDPNPSPARHDPSNTDAPTIRAEDALQDAETEREARDEAERLGAVPYGTVARGEPTEETEGSDRQG